MATGSRSIRWCCTSAISGRSGLRPRRFVTRFVVQAIPVVLARMQASGWFAGCRGVAPTCGTWRFRSSAQGRSSGLRGVAQQALGCRARFGAAFEDAENARQFFLALPCLALLHRALRDDVAGGRDYQVVPVALL